MRASAMSTLHSRIARQVEEPLCHRRDRLVASSMWVKHIRMGVLNRPWLTTAQTIAGAEGYCDVCHRRGRTTLSMVRERAAPVH